MNRAKKNNTCIAILKSKKTQCSFRTYDGFRFCKRHYKLFLQNNISIVDDNLINRKKQILNQKTIVCIQSIIRKYLILKLINTRGIGVLCPHICNNITDCYTLENITDIAPYTLFSYKENNLYWIFKLNTFKKLLENDMGNPYSLAPFSKSVIRRFKTIRELLHAHKNNIVIDSKYKTAKYLLQQKCIDIFQLMDKLKNYTKCEWFLDLKIHSLIKLYYYIQDIWIYRLELSSIERKKYIKTSVFSVKYTVIKKNTNYYYLANMILDDFHKLLTEGDNLSDKSTASQWILSSLTLVNKDARLALPWLYQSAYV